jgi:hypothetical protein
MIKEADMNGDGQVDYPGVYNVCLMLMITIWSNVVFNAWHWPCPISK